MSSSRVRFPVPRAILFAPLASLACGSTDAATSFGASGGGGAGFWAGNGGTWSASGGATAAGETGSGGAPDGDANGGGASGDPGASTGGAAQSGGAPPYDPNVAFDWPETAPQAGACEPGTYVGTFTCSVDATAWGLPPAGTGGAASTGGAGGASSLFTFTGPVKFTLSSSQSGEFLEINDGTLVADASAGGLPMSAKLSGKLDCATNRLQVDIVDGKYTIFIFTGAFLGTLGGSLDRLTSTLDGTWHLADANNAGSCTGSWSAVKQ